MTTVSHGTPERPFDERSQASTPSWGSRASNIPFDEMSFASSLASTPDRSVIDKEKEERKLLNSIQEFFELDENGNPVAKTSTVEEEVAKMKALYSQSSTALQTSSSSTRMRYVSLSNNLSLTPVRRFSPRIRKGRSSMSVRFADSPDNSHKSVSTAETQESSTASPNYYGSEESSCEDSDAAHVGSDTEDSSTSDSPAQQSKRKTRRPAQTRTTSTQGEPSILDWMMSFFFGDLGLQQTPAHPRKANPDSKRQGRTSKSSGAKDDSEKVSDDMLFCCAMDMDPNRMLETAAASFSDNAVSREEKPQPQLSGIELDVAKAVTEFTDGMDFVCSHTDEDEEAKKALNNLLTPKIGYEDDDEPPADASLVAMESMVPSDHSELAGASLLSSGPET